MPGIFYFSPEGKLPGLTFFKNKIIFYEEELDLSFNRKNPCQWNTDWEGVFGFNDMAFELTKEFHLKGRTAGEEFFTKISKVDDWWSLTRDGYHAGTTLVLILPFLKAWGVTDDKMRKYAADNLRLMPGTKETLSNLRKTMPVFVISTTYSNCMIPVAELASIPEENLYCTQVKLDSYQFSSKETQRIGELAEEIDDMPMLDWPDRVSREENLSQEMQKVAKRLYEIFWSESELMGMEAYRRMIEEIKVIGGPGKAEAIEDSCQKTGNSLFQTAYTGDSITDTPALTKVRENGGLAISVNGNRYAVRAADIACMLNHTIVLEILLSTFAKGGKDSVLELVRNWSWKAVEDFHLEENLITRLHQIFPEELPSVKIVPTVATMPKSPIESLVEESEAFRKHIRGEVIGKLG